MKILIVSDTHGKHENFLKVLDLESPIDLLIHLGDAEGYEEELAKWANCPLEAVAGNNDFFSALLREKELYLKGHHLLLTHGHYYCVNAGVEHLQREGKARGCDIVLFGHTHRPMLECQKGVTLLNPGSLSYPRQEGKRPSYGILELKATGEMDSFIRYLESV